MSTIPIKTYGLPYIYNYCFFILSYKIYNTTVTTPDIKNTSNAHRFIPIKSVHSTAEIPPSISTIVYLADIFAPQYLHLPLRLIQEIIGIRSFLTSSCLHVVHMDFPKENCSIIICGCKHIIVRYRKTGKSQSISKCQLCFRFFFRFLLHKKVSF